MAFQHDASCEDTSVETKINNDDKVSNADGDIDCKMDNGHDKNINDKSLNLGEFLASRLSNAAMKRLKEHLESGDLKLETVNQCNEQELETAAKEYGLGTFQTKDFVNAIKQLPNSKVSRMGTNIDGSINRKNTFSISDNVNTKTSSDNSDKNRKDYESKEAIDRILAQDEREIQDKLHELRQLLDNQKKTNEKWIAENEQKHKKNNEKLDKIANLLKQHIDTIISKLKQKQWEEFESYKLQIGMIEGDFNQEYKNIEKNEKKLKEINKTDIMIDVTSLRNVVDRKIAQATAACESSITNDIVIIDMNKPNSETTSISDIATKIKKQIDALDNINPSTTQQNFAYAVYPSPTEKTAVTSRQQAMPEIPLYQLDRQSQSQIKLERNEYKHEQEHITILRKGSSINCNQRDWHWDYCSKSNGFWTKHIKNDKKTFNCSAKGFDCRCFARCNTPMKPNSGIYKIKFKIDKISNKESLANIIGITCNTDNNNNWLETHHYWYYSNDYFGWSSYEIGDNDTWSSDDYTQYIQGGLLCGSSMCQNTNMFYNKPVKYQSYISKYETRLPCLKSNDIVVLEYDSDNGSMRFGKKSKFKDDDLNSVMIACLTNLPRSEPFYWMVGHEHDPMIVNIIDD